MVQKKRLDNRSTGFQVPVIPRAPRSPRRRALHKKKADSINTCAIELLASLADKLLQETESSASNAASEETDQLVNNNDALQYNIEGEDEPLKSEEQGSCGDSVFVSEQASENSQQKDSLKRSPEVESNTLWDCSSVFTGSACAEKEKGDLKPIVSKSNFLRSGTPKSETLVAVDEQAADVACLKKDSIGDYANRPCLINAFSLRQNSGIKLDRKDDDENSSQFNRSKSTKFKPSKRSHHIVDRRIRKLLTSKHWKRAPQLKDVESFKSDGGRKVSNQKRRNFHSRDPYHCDFLHKRRKLFDGSCSMTSDGALSSESDYSSHQIGANGGDCVSFDAKNSHVKFSIKSFKIPKLFIDVPETATVGSLKRTVVEAMTTILGSGLHVGVLLQGKKIRDDSWTLLQAGISCKENLETLGFMLEPNLTQPSPTSIDPEDSPCTLPCDIPQQPRRTLDKSISDMGASDSESNPANLISMCNNNVDNSSELIVSSTSDIATGAHLSESRALVPSHETNVEPLAIVPANQKNKHSEPSQRRIRRPFSVSEVEALVQAVEEIGTGRWRDVKLRSFKDADHRTYVDLKDKWKTLVHTASIAAQQRRGEPVPQELLDRVTTAHSYWSQHQPKQNHKVNDATVSTSLNITNGPAVLPGIRVEGI